MHSRTLLCAGNALVCLFLLCVPPSVLSKPIPSLPPFGSAGHERRRGIEDGDASTSNITDIIKPPDDVVPFLRGVNTGGWLIVEKWMTPDIFSGTNATDQWTFDSTPDALSRLTTHWDTWFTQKDVQSLKDVGVNA